MSADPPQLLPIDELNRLPRERFAEALRPLFEAAAPLATALHDGRPYLAYDALLERADEIVSGLPEAEQGEIINAHPRIGADPEAVRRESTISYQEQGYEGEATLDRADLARVYRELAELNRAYEARFGFRFVVFVAGRPKSAIVEVLRERLGNGRDQELATARRDMLRIARDRLKKLSG